MSVGGYVISFSVNSTFISAVTVLFCGDFFDYPGLPVIPDAMIVPLVSIWLGRRLAKREKKRYLLTYFL